MKIFVSTMGIFLGTILGYLIFENAYVGIAIGIGLYMAINIGANDVANSVGPAVGSSTITMKQAIIIAAIGNFSGAVIAGADVVKTIKKGIIDVSTVGSVYGGQGEEVFVIIMLSAMLAGALWLTFATYLNAPVSTTHSIVGGIMGSGIIALGFSAVSWSTMGKIAASWFISPLLGGIIAAIFLLGIKRTILFRKDRVGAAKVWVPFFVAIMSWAFTTYIIVKGIKHLIKVDFLIAAVIGLLIAVITYFIVMILLKKKTSIKNSKQSIGSLFTIPLVFSIALLTFAHGANDVANAIGPLAAIFDTAMNGGIGGKVVLPLWILIIGGLGISLGLSLFGAKIIKTVGSGITQLDRIRAFCIALSASITVIIASQLGLPVSSTHIAIGGVIGVGLLREWIYRKERKAGEHYVDRSSIKKIIAAWFITVPAAAVLSAALFLLLSFVML